MLRLRLDRNSPTPIYHQIVQAIRWRIGTGALREGDPLPTLRVAADLWQVNYHTVRRAYRELAEQGLVEPVQGSGTRVAAALPPVRPTADGELTQWLSDVVETGSARFGLSAADVAERLREHRRLTRVVVVECNAHESAVLARQLEEAWSVEAIAWSLEEQREPPQLPIIGTYFHHAEMRRRWPHRVDDMQFVTLHLDPTLKDRIERAAARLKSRVLRVVEQDSATAKEIAQGVATLLSSRYRIEAVVGNPSLLLRSLPRSGLLLVAPRLWGALPAAVRKDPRVFDLCHVIVPADLQRVWRALNAAGEPSPASLRP